MTMRAASRSHASRAVFQTKEIAYWLGAQRHVPEVGEIIARWHVSRSTAWRFHRFALDQLRIYNGGTP